MKRTITICLIIFCFNISFAQLNTLVSDSNGNQKLLGPINTEGLQQTPFNDWFNTNYDTYQINPHIVERLQPELSKFEIKVFLGTWCGDSKREVPRFYHILDAVNFPKTQLEVIAVDNDRDTYKQSPTSEEKGLNIHRVPTFIFYKDGQEVNRIVESPVETLERDMLSIIQNEGYRPNYRAVSYLEQLMNEQSIEQLQSNELTVLSNLSEIIKGCYELNTYAYVKLRAQQLEVALYIFDLNAKLFPYKDYIQYSLGNAYFIIENHEAASKAFYKALSLNPNYERAKEGIDAINSATD